VPRRKRDDQTAMKRRRLSEYTARNISDFGRQFVTPRGLTLFLAELCMSAFGQKADIATCPLYPESDIPRRQQHVR
jgi:hypothetical protein